MHDVHRWLITKGLEHVAPVMSVKIRWLLLLLRHALWSLLVARHNITGRIQVVTRWARRSRRRSHMGRSRVVLYNRLFR